MTLNLTVVTSRCIYQSADYRLIDGRTRTWVDFQTQKVFLVNAFTWNALVCFAGVGHTGTMSVAEWLSKRVAAITPNDPFDRLLEELLSADNWLSRMREPFNRHSFSVGAFIGSQPLFALISNFEKLSGLEAPNAARHLSIEQMRPTKPQAFVSGQKREVTRPQRRRLEALAGHDPEPKRMYDALFEENHDVARRCTYVSPACFTAHVRLTGEGGGFAHDVDSRPPLMPFALPAEASAVIERLIAQQFGTNGGMIRQVAIGRSEPTEEFYQTQLREKPMDTDVHSNYGAFLHDIQGDLEGAEREYRRAIELNANHVNALGNLANLRWEKSDRDQAAKLYRNALDLEPGNENVTWNYARFLLQEFNDRQAAREALDSAIERHPESARLHLLRAECYLIEGRAAEALHDVQRASDLKADQGLVEAVYAVAAKHPENATLLRLVSRIMAGEEDPVLLDEVLTQWSSDPPT